MSATATLLAEDSPALRGRRPPLGRSPTRCTSPSARWVPVFWMFCFEADDLTDVELDGEQVPTLASPLIAVGKRLAARDAVAREWFPGFAELWGRWRQAIGGLGQKDLKLDSYAVSCVGGPGTSHPPCSWRMDGPDPHGLDLEYLLDLAGVAEYDEEQRSFRPPAGYEPEGCLAGYADEVVIWHKASPPARKRRRPR